MREVGAKASIRGGSAYCMAVHAGIAFKHSPTCDCACVFGSGSLLSANPGGKILLPIHRNAQQHFRVLCSAVLGTLAKKDTCALRIHPHSVGVVRNEVGFACKLWHPKAVVSIGRKHLQKRWCRMTRITHRDVQFIGCDDPQPRISKLPPVLMSNRGDLYSARRFWSILNRVDYSRGGQEQDNDNQNWNDRPSQLNLRASIHLSRLPAGILRSPPELNDGIDQ